MKGPTKKKGDELNPINKFDLFIQNGKDLSLPFSDDSIYWKKYILKWCMNLAIRIFKNLEKKSVYSLESIQFRLKWERILWGQKFNC